MKRFVIPHPGRFVLALVRTSKRLLLGDDVLASEWTKMMRRQACRRCPQLVDSGQCRKCSCFVSLKTILAGEKCPLNKW